eukprot:CAMPEP_0174307560 /NCGR_PEP_ID=MMETSP0810-20121108/1195_1 /TAXON_ID=73025 ORGANISM="Eutreptiella gymnastica-like, Strain CCMP1594" /NCGR_SAMPLE_ID=MMETSP0810 /ASSEMBLY_ACC=CAM_ASM_000659 /LENGTH=107 /DNA_ID=CAMNT_0015414641 /DNA_START=192 /DNA_END=515 /DNA_ORIENTATION=-
MTPEPTYRRFTNMGSTLTASPLLCSQNTTSMSNTSAGAAPPGLWEHPAAHDFTRWFPPQLGAAQRVLQLSTRLSPANDPPNVSRVAAHETQLFVEAACSGPLNLRTN